MRKIFLKVMPLLEGSLKLSRNLSRLSVKKALYLHKLLQEHDRVRYVILPVLTVAVCLGLSAFTGHPKIQNNGVSINSSIELTALKMPLIDVPNKDLLEVIVFKPNEKTLIKAGQVLAVFKEPDLKKRDGDIVTFQYQSEQCVADFHILSRKGGNVSNGKVSNIIFMTRDTVISEQKNEFANALKEQGEQKDCLEAILKDKETPSKFFKFASAEITK